MRYALAAAILVAGALDALLGVGRQQEQDCDLEVLRTPGSRGEMVTLPDGEVRIDQWGGVEAVCGDRRLRADSASYYQNRGILYLVGNMRYEDETRQLVAERGTYYEREARMRAEGDVRLTDVEGRSTLTTQLLDYYPANENRPRERMFAPGRPHLTYYPEASGDSNATPFDVDADRLHIYGDSAVAGAGRVVSVRGELVANSDSMDLDLGSERLWLLDDPEVISAETRLAGDTILVLMEDQEIQEIQAWPHASATSPEISLEAPSLRMFVDGEEIDRVVAARGDPERTGAEDAAGRAPWASSRSADYTLVADSIEVQRPGGRVDRVIAVARARAEGTEEVIPGGGPLSRDWLEGDTITGFFSAPDSSAPAGAAGDGRGEAELTRLVATGNARALHYVRQEEGGNGQVPAPNYVKGKRIVLELEAGEVHEVRVIGPARGIYLEPIPRSPDDTVAADTSGMAAPVVPDSVLEAWQDTARAIRDSLRADSVSRTRPDTVPGDTVPARRWRGTR